MDLVDVIDFLFEHICEVVLILIGSMAISICITTLICNDIKKNIHKNVKKIETADYYLEQELIEYEAIEDRHIEV
jgi:hypothetical protein